MATFSNVQDDTEKAIECSVCMLIMTHPKQLRCGHSFCSGCIDKLPQRGNPPKLQCPICRSHSAVPQNTNFLASSLISQLSIQEKQRRQCDGCKKKCMLENLMICHTCGDKLLCCSCLIPTHDGHKRNKLQEHMNKHKQAMHVKGAVESWGGDDAVESWGGDVPPSRRNCAICSELGHFLHNCPETHQPGKVPDDPTYRCGSCGARGEHLQPDCEGVKCYNCNEIGHISKNCPLRRRRR